MSNLIAKNYGKIFRTSTRGGCNSHARLFVRMLLPDLKGDALLVVSNSVSEKFELKTSREYVEFNTRADFAKFQSLFVYVHEKLGGKLALACWDRGCQDDDYKELLNIEAAEDDTATFWAVVAAAQMYFGKD